MEDAFPQGGNVMENLIAMIKAMRAQFCVVRFYVISQFRVEFKYENHPTNYIPNHLSLLIYFSGEDMRA